MKIVIVGATSLVAEHCARLWVQKDAVELVLIARDLERVRRVEGDLRVRNPTAKISSMVASFSEPADIEAVVSMAFKGGNVDVVLLAHGSLTEQEICSSSLEVCREILFVNGVSAALFAEAFASRLERTGTGSLILIGSVAGDRGRRSNYSYGSAKALIEVYAQGLRHRLSASGVHVMLVKPGPIETPMTAAMNLRRSLLESPETVARFIVNGAFKRREVVYVPRKWRIIMFVVRILPSFIFNRLRI